MKYCRNILTLLLVYICYTGTYAQENIKINDPENFLSKKERKIFERAANYEASFYNLIFPDKKVDFSNIKFTIIPNYISYLSYVNNAGGPIHIDSPGIYFPSKQELVICTDKKYRKGFIAIFCHELSHAFLHLHAERRSIPAWLNEGLAVYLQEMTYDKKIITHNTNTQYVARVKTLIDIRDLDLSDFVKWDYRKFSQESFSQEGYGYAIAYCMTNFLIQQHNEIALKIIQNSIGKSAARDVFDEFYPDGFQQFEQDFIKYWSR
jgi:hypothetical protein